MTTSSTERERDKLDGLDGLEKWETIKKIRFLHTLLGRAKSPTRSVSIYIGRTEHLDFIWSFWEVCVSLDGQSCGSTGDKHQPQSLNSFVQLFSMRHSSHSASTCTRWLLTGTSDPVVRVWNAHTPVPYFPTSLASQILKAYTSLLIFADKQLRRRRLVLISTPLHDC